MEETKKNLVPLFAALMMTMLLASLSQMMLSSALPTIVGELRGVQFMPWVITAYMLASTITMPIYGKLGDMWGRKPLLLGAIALFIAGSALGMVSNSMPLLIASRAIQGLGGGGLIILAQTAIADVIPPRERGKYMGILGGVFAFSSVAGPLLGGWLTEGPGWRWAFILNIPLGLLAMAGVAVLMQLPKPSRDKAGRTDYAGMTVLATATTTIVLIATWGGKTYAWNSLEIVGLVIGAVVLLVAFIIIEQQAQEPIIPLSLFKERNFVITTLAASLVSIAMFGAMAYMPTYFQMSAGVSASVAGLLMAPMMLMLLGTSIVTGALVSKSGRYKSFPITGSGVLAVGLVLLSSVSVKSPTFLICLFIGIVGLGLGMSVQIFTLVVQNSFPHKVVGTATAATNYFRQVGSSLGSAAVGSLFTARLSQEMLENLPEGAGEARALGSLTPAALQSLPDSVRLVIVQAYNDALIPIFLYLAPLGACAAVLMVFLKEKQLGAEVKREVAAESLGEGQVLVSEMD
ncbi:MFS transporter [bacterium]|nr:MAG: MFS transporter [bacterium]